MSHWNSTCVRGRSNTSKRSLSGGNHPLRADPRQAPEVARHTRSLMTGAARQMPRVDDFREAARIAPGEGPLSQRRTKQFDDGYRSRGGDVKRAAISSNEERSTDHERAQVGQRKRSAVE